MTAMEVRLLGTGKYLPARVVDNDELEDRLGLRRGWIVKRTGIESRRYVDRETTSEMVLPAAAQALEAAGLTPGDLDVIVGACALPEQAIPVTSCFVQARLGPSAAGSACFDVNATCISFPTAMNVASMMIHQGLARHALVFSCEAASLALDFNSPTSCVIFGDGAAAVVLGPAEGTKSRVLPYVMRTYSEGRHLAELEGGGTRSPPDRADWGPEKHKFRMNGRGIFKLAARTGGQFLEEVWARTGLQQEDVKLLIPHQTSAHGNALYTKRLGFRPERVFQNLSTHGNCVSASIPIALHDALAEGRLQRGEVGMLAGTAAGLTVGALPFVY